MQVFSLVEQTALVTGGGTGLGRAIAACMVQAGARVVITGRRESVLQQAAAELGPAVATYRHDVTDPDQTAALIERLRQDERLPTVLVHNAGIHTKKPFGQTRDEDFLALFHTHVLGACTLTRALTDPAVQPRGGHVLFITSMAALFAIPSVSAYTAAKSAQAGLVRALALELAPAGWRVNALAPGWIETEMSARALADDEARRRRVLERTALGRLGRPEEVGWAAVFLSSPAASFITGQQLAVDGGMSTGF